MEGLAGNLAQWLRVFFALLEDQHHTGGSQLHVTPVPGGSNLCEHRHTHQKPIPPSHIVKKS